MCSITNGITSVKDDILNPPNDYQCSVCFELILDPVKPSIDQFSWYYLKYEKIAVCTHSFCKKCFDEILQKSSLNNNCPLCRAEFSTCLPDHNLQNKISVFVENYFSLFGFKVSYADYARENRFMRPTFENIKIWLKCGKYDEAKRVIRILSNYDQMLGYFLLINNYTIEKKYVELEDLFSELSASFTVHKESIALYLIDRYLEIISVDKIDIDNDIEEISYRIETKIVPYVDEKFASSLKDKFYRSIANKYYELGNKQKAYLNFLNLSSGDIESKLFISLYTKYVNSNQLSEAEALLKKMSDKWKKENDKLLQSFIPDKQEDIFEDCLVFEENAEVIQEEAISQHIEYSYANDNRNKVIILFLSMLVITISIGVNTIIYSNNNND